MRTSWLPDAAKGLAVGRETSPSERVDGELDEGDRVPLPEGYKAPTSMGAPMDVSAGNSAETGSLATACTMRPGDRIAIKSSYTRKHDLPFDNRGNAVSVMAIKAIGTITDNRHDGKHVRVDWTKLDPPREWYFYTHRGTAWRIMPGHAPGQSRPQKAVSPPSGPASGASEGGKPGNTGTDRSGKRATRPVKPRRRKSGRDETDGSPGTPQPVAGLPKKSTIS